MLVKRPSSSFTTMPRPFVALQATACSTSAPGTPSSLLLAFCPEDAIPAVVVAVDAAASAAAALELGLLLVGAVVGAASIKKPSIRKAKQARNTNEASDALLMPQAVVCSRCLGVSAERQQ